MAQLRKNRYASFYDASMDDETLDNELATATSDGLMSKEDKIKLDGITVTDTGGVKIPATNIETTKDHQFISEEEKQKLNGLETTEDGKVAVSVDNIITSENKQFITNEQITKIEESIAMEYDPEQEAFILY